MQESDRRLCFLIKQEYIRWPFYGIRWMKRVGAINRKRVQRLMCVMGLAGIAPGPNTGRAHLESRLYPYFLRYFGKPEIFNFDRNPL